MQRERFMIDTNILNHFFWVQTINCNTLAHSKLSSSSPSSCHAASTALPDHLSPPISIVHRSQVVFKATSCIGTELLYIGFSWSSCFARLCEEVHRIISHRSSSLLLQQCPACLVRLTWIVFVMGDRWAYSCCFVASRTCLILLAAFLYNCRQAFSPYV